MQTFFKTIPALLCSGLFLFAPHAQGKTPLSLNDFLAVKWVSQATLSPDNKWVAYVVTTLDKEQNKKFSNLYIVRPDHKGGSTRRLTNHQSKNFSPAFSPDGKRVAFISTRSGKPQIWMIRLDGGEARQITDLTTGAGGPLVWSPNGKKLAFSSSVFPDCKNDACNAKKLKAKKESKVKARIIDELLFRHWNSWRDEQRSHIFIVSSAGGTPRDLTPGPHDAPPIALGSSLDYAFSPDGKSLAFVMNTDSDVATSTNNDVFEVPLSGGKARRISHGKGNDNSPRYSPDGRYLAYLSMERAAYESDRPRIMVLDRKSGRLKEWSRGFQDHPVELLWAPLSKTLYFTAYHKGYVDIFAATSSGIRQVGSKHIAKFLNITSDGKYLIFTHEAADHPPEVYRLTVDGKEQTALSHLNGWLNQKRDLKPAEHHWFQGAKGEQVHAVLVKPPGFRKGKKYKALLMIHGGPQGMTGDDFHPRWNLQMFARMGYVVFGLNFHGSVGFGQNFTDSIHGDWGGKPYEDVLKGTEYLAKLPFVDGKKICAAGASYGGYMVNWIATHTRRFKCLISHAGPYNLESKYGSTEELWFPEWDLKGTPWTNRALYRKWSPHSYAENMHTPTLVIHGQLDYRVPVEQGLQMFTVLRRQGIPARLLYFPDEDHFVKKPQNIVLWWNTMEGWLKKYLK